jgi:hypothetical protein
VTHSRVVERDFPFSDPVEAREDVLIGAWRMPRQLLGAQTYDGHASIHDDATAQRLGFRGGTIEGPTHFSQIAPLCVAAYGPQWFESGCISAHYRNPCFEGDRIRALLSKPKEGASQSAVWIEKEDGTEILRGTASVGLNHPPSELEQRLTRLETLVGPVILRDVRVGMKTERRAVAMPMNQIMGALYPFSLADKLRVITEPSPWYTTERAHESPWARPIIPMEMISVLLNYTKAARPFPVRGPAVALFADQEIRLIRGPLLVGDSYEIDQEIVALSGSRRTESMWVRTRVYEPGSDDILATMLLNSAILKDSYPNYDAERGSSRDPGS